MRSPASSTPGAAGTPFASGRPGATPPPLARPSWALAGSADERPVSDRRARFVAFAQLTSLLAATVGAMVVAGWMLEVDSLQRLQEHLPRTSLEAGFAMALIGAASSVSCRAAPRGGLRVAVWALASGALALCALSLWRAWSQSQAGLAGEGSLRMAPGSALSFLLLSGALLLRDAPHPRALWAAQVMCLTAFTVGFLALIGYAYDIRPLYEHLANAAMKLPAAALTVLLSLGLLASRPDRGWIAFLLGEHVGASLARRLLAVGLVLTPLLGWLELAGEHLGYYSREEGMAALVVCAVLLLGVLLFRHTLTLARSDLERQRAQAAAQLSDERFRSLTLAAADAIIMVDEDQRIRLFNRSAELLFGHRAEELLGRELDLLLPQRFAEAHRRHVRDFAQAPETTRRMASPREVFGRRKDGSEFPLEATIAKIRQEGRWFFTVILRDISQRKEDERRLGRYAADLERSNRDLQEFASVASHDLHEPLRKIVAFADLLRERAAPVLDESSLEYVERLEGAARRMQELIDSLLQLARVETQAQPFVPTQLSEVLEEVLTDLEFAVRESGARIEVGALPVIEGDPVQMRRLFQNLLGNAIKFRAPGRRLHVRVSAEPLPGGRWQIAVEDNGIGFEERFREQIFKPFQRLHPRSAYGGSGMGLAICRKIALRHQGELTATSQPGTGSRFLLILPCTPLAVET